MWRLDDVLVRRLYARSRAERWHVSVDDFASFLKAGARREFGDAEPAPPRLERHCESLHLEDLALACACAHGIETAWDAFIVQFRPVLYRAADALDPSGGAREVADSLYAELFGLKSSNGERQSQLRYFHGRSSLATWLRAVLAQRYVDRMRRDARVEQLTEDAADQFVAGHAGASMATRLVEIVQRLIAVVVAALPARDRLRLRCYYAQDMTLAEIGRMLGESEATASRSLARTRRTIREQVERRLRDDEKMSEAEISECFAALVEDAGPIDLAALVPAEVEGMASGGAEGRARPQAVARKKGRLDRSK